MKKKIFLILFCLIFIFFLVEGKYFLTDGFCVKKIIYKGDFNSCWNQEQIDPAIFLKGQFIYVGKGRQCYVFENKKKGIVIKFIRFHKYKEPLWAKIFSYCNVLTEKQKMVLKEKKERYENGFKSYKIALNELKDFSKVFYVHLNQTDFLKKTILLKDRCNRVHKIEADKFAFILQKKVSCFKKVFLQKDDFYKKELISSFFQSLQIKIENKIMNKDLLNVIRNAGVLDNQFVDMDVGSFIKVNKDKKFWQIHFIKYSDKLKNFLQKEKPEYLNFFYEKRREMRECLK